MTEKMRKAEVLSRELRLGSGRFLTQRRGIVGLSFHDYNRQGMFHKKRENSL